ncbi:MAG TPA: Arc family DNA-binding protein [Desulfuromonadales bacterium]|nr:Arc family DNA-binding protein [Desulfuromonadales bacterium]
MASITIRNLDNSLKEKLRLRAAHHGCSMESEVRMILSQSLNMPGGTINLAGAIHKRFVIYGIKNLPIPSRQPVRNPPDFAE